MKDKWKKEQEYVGRVSDYKEVLSREKGEGRLGWKRICPVAAKL